MNLLGFAARNIMRNRQRTVVTVLAMAFAGFLMIFYISLMNGFVLVMVRNAVGMDLGDIQIHAKNYREDPDLYKRVENADELVDALKAKGFSATTRLYGYGLAASGTASSGIIMRGIDLENEPTVTRISGHVMKGRWLESGDAKGAVIGKKLARTLGAKPGDEIVVLSQAADGSMANDLFIVRGVLKSIGDTVDRAGFLITREAFRELMALPDGAHEIAVSLKDRTSDLESASKTVMETTPGLEVKNWRELRPVIAQWLDLVDVSNFIMTLIAYTAITMVVLNAMLMSVFERIHEIGIMKAVGLGPWHVSSMVFLESMMQTAVAVGLAAAAGIPVSLYYQEHGVDLSWFTGGGTIAGIAFDPVWHCWVTAGSVLMPVVMLFAVTVIAVIYPAAKAAFVTPVKPSITGRGAKCRYGKWRGETSGGASAGR